MNRGRAAEISATAATVDVGDVTTRYLLYGLLPGWFVPGLTMTKAGLPIALTLRREVNPGEEQGPVEQHIHSFLESLPFAGLASLMCLHSDQVKSLLRGGRGDPDAWRLVPRRRPLSPGYGEELLRCARASRARKKLSRKGR
ncbi:hypothetical protein [Streptomyces canus]|uniref:hypothetical protein n=1 Tax=Streptomyces canus TaxID=58343 RepID=UPI00324C55D9